MSEIQRLLRVARNRNRRDEYGQLVARLLKADIAALRRQLEEDGISTSVLLEAVARAYVGRHPGILGIIDDWRREQGVSREDTPRPRFKKGELDELYAAIGGGTMETEDK